VTVRSNSTTAPRNVDATRAAPSRWSNDRSTGTTRTSEVVDVRADDVSDGDVAQPGQRGVGRHDEFRRRRPHRDHGQPDGPFGEAEASRQPDDRIDQQTRSDPEADDGADEESELEYDPESDHRLPC
jgi:hypothetical protein